MRINLTVAVKFFSVIAVVACCGKTKAQTNNSFFSDATVSATPTETVRTSRYRFVPSIKRTDQSASPSAHNPKSIYAQPLPTEKTQIQQAAKNRIPFSGPFDQMKIAPVVPARNEFQANGTTTPRVAAAAFQTSVIEQFAQSPIRQTLIAPDEVFIEGQTTAPRSMPIEIANLEPAPSVLLSNVTSSETFPMASIVAGQSQNIQSIEYAPVYSFFGIHEDETCDEWAGFCNCKELDYDCGCGGLKANPGHLGIRWLRGNAPCETSGNCGCQTCSKKNKSTLGKFNLFSRKSCGGCESSTCSTCNPGSATQTGLFSFSRN